tara:strand:- start:144 stop:446 length:303 start_codon:yes stop_codon:yes gene_type:complete
VQPLLLEEVGVEDMGLQFPVKREEVVGEVLTAAAVALEQLGKAIQVDPGQLGEANMLVGVAVELVRLVQAPYSRHLWPREMEEMVRTILLIAVWLKQLLF